MRGTIRRGPEGLQGPFYTSEELALPDPRLPLHWRSVESRIFDFPQPWRHCSRGIPDRILANRISRRCLELDGADACHGIHPPATQYFKGQEKIKRIQ